jgi:outer membrane protein assembly factor BamB
MKTLFAPVILAALVAAANLTRPAGKLPQEPSSTELAGIWIANASHNGESSPIAFRLEVNEDGGLLAKWSTPAIHVWDLPLGSVKVDGKQVHVGPMVLIYDRTADTLAGVLPAAFVPVYSLPVTFRRVPELKSTPRPELAAMIARPVWVFDAQAPIWADLAFSKGMVLIGADDGRLHALDSRTGHPRWTFRADGSVRARPIVSDDNVFVQADDGFLYKLDLKTGKPRWRVRVARMPVKRVPIGEPNSRYDYRASAVAVANNRVYLGTDDGEVLSLDSDRGTRLWTVTVPDAVVSTPVVEAGRLYFGSFDGSVYALDASSGRMIWRHETGGPVTTAPALAAGVVIIGSRSYDLMALDAATGEPAWTRYYWFSWVESPATVFRGSVYIGSSDAANLFAFDLRTGGRLWDVDAGGCIWAQPAVTERRLFVGTVGFLNYLTPHRATLIAVDRETGHPAWRYPLVPPESASPDMVVPYGFSASPALGNGLVYFGGLDHYVYAFEQ